jgi:hypothetical protein
VSFDDFDTAVGKDAAAERAIRDRAEAFRYLLALVIQLVGFALLVAGLVVSNGWLSVLGLALLVTTGWYFAYLAQRARDRVEQGDYMIGPRLRWQAAAYGWGALVGRAIRVIRADR